MTLVMPGLDPGIHGTQPLDQTRGMDCRVEPGNDNEGTIALIPVVSS